MIRPEARTKALGGSSAREAGSQPLTLAFPNARLRNGLVLRLLEWFSEHARDLPWRRIREPYAVWVSEIMLQQTRVATVIPYYERWMGTLPDLASLAKAEPDQVLRLWEGLGYYSRARRLQESAVAILRDYGGVFPRKYDDVLMLPGIGKYTAGAVCSIAYGDPVPVLDGNVARVFSRVFGFEQDLSRKPAQEWLWKMAEGLVQTACKLTDQVASPNPCGDLNQGLMELGALVCTPTNPSCSVCPWNRFCKALARGRTDRIPHRKTKAKPIQKRVLVLLIEREERYLVRRRVVSDVNGAFWEFPCGEVLAGEEDRDCLVRLAELSPADGWRHVAELKHCITKYRYTSVGYSWNRKDALDADGLGTKWMTPKQLQRVALVTAHRRLFHRFLALGRLKSRSFRS